MMNPIQPPVLRDSWLELASFAGPIGPTELIVHDTPLINKSFVHYNDRTPSTLFGVKMEKPVEMKRQPTHSKHIQTKEKKCSGTIKTVLFQYEIWDIPIASNIWDWRKTTGHVQIRQGKRIAE